MGLKILITGSSGYIGRHLVDYLLKKTDFSLFLLQGKDSDRPFKDKRVKYYFYNEVSFDIYRLLSDIKPDLVVHLAGLIAPEHNKETLSVLLDSNFVFGLRLLDAMNEAGVKNIVSTGTYAENYKQGSFYSYNPVSLYAALKRSFFDVLKYYVEACDFNAITLRLYHVYGVDDDKKKIIQFLLDAANNNIVVDISPGEQFINFVYIDDVISAYVKAINFLLTKKSSNLIFDVGSKKSIRLKDLVFLIESLYSKKINVNFGGRSYRLREIMNAKPNLIKINRVLGWSPRFSVEAGLLKILENLND